MPNYVTAELYVHALHALERDYPNNFLKLVTAWSNLVAHNRL